MNAVIEYEPADLTLTAQAGLSLTRLREVAAEGGQWLAVDAGAWGTLGGLVATATAGSLEAGFSGPRDHVLGVTLVTGDGRVLRLGGRVVKNVAGFDLLKMAVGSWGTLGVMTEVTVRLFPLPEAEVTLVWTAERASDLVPVARRLAVAPVVPDALELVTDSNDMTGPGATLLLRRLGTREDVDKSVEIFRSVAQRAVDRTVADGDSRALFDGFGVGATSTSGRNTPSGAAGACVQVRALPNALHALTEIADAANARARISVTEGLLALDGLDAEDARAPLLRGLLESVPARQRRTLVVAGGTASSFGSPASIDTPEDALRGPPADAPAQAPANAATDAAAAALVDTLADDLVATFDPGRVLWPSDEAE